MKLSQHHPHLSCIFPGSTVIGSNCRSLPGKEWLPVGEGCVITGALKQPLCADKHFFTPHTETTAESGDIEKKPALQLPSGLTQNNISVRPEDKLLSGPFLPGVPDFSDSPLSGVHLLTSREMRQRKKLLPKSWYQRAHYSIKQFFCG